MKSSSLRLFESPFSRQLLYELFKNSYYFTYTSTAIWIMLFLSYLVFQQTWYNMLDSLALRTRVVVAVAFKKVDTSPYTKACAKCDYECLQYSDHVVKECHTFLFSPKNPASYHILHFHSTSINILHPNPLNLRTTLLSLIENDL